MKQFYQLNREIITIGGIEWNITTHSVDMTAWHLAYTKGIRSPNYPVPAIKYSAKWQAGEVRIYRHVKPSWQFEYSGVHWFKELATVFCRRKKKYHD